MHAETGVFFPHFHSFSQLQQIEDSWKTQKPNASLTAMVQSSTICDYDMGGEGGLFEAPKPIVEEEPVVVPIDPVSAAAISMISCGEDLMSSQGLDPLLSDVFYECKKELLEKAGMESLLSAPFQKSISSGSLTSVEGIMNGGTTKPSFLEFHGVDAASSVGRMRRAFSEGDVKALCNNQIGSLSDRLPSILTIEERKEKLLRYRNKRSKRNFGRKIKYACRKVLADSQPRIRGRFAKTEECDAKKAINFSQFYEAVSCQGK